MSFGEILTYVCTTLGSGFIAAIVVYHTTKFKKSAEIDTITTNLEEIKKQQITLTTATEQVKEDLKHQTWKKQEHEQLIREKIEEYYILIDAMPKFTIKHYYETLDSNLEKTEDTSMKASMISALYLLETCEKQSEIMKIMGSYFEFIQEVQERKSVGDLTLEEDLLKVEKYHDQILEKTSDVKIILAVKVNSILNSY